jgi:hypothetical protein
MYLNKSSTIEKSYVIRPYEVLKVSDTISEIPQDLALNNTFMNQLTNLQLLSIEGVATRFLMLDHALAGMELSEKTVYLEERKQFVLETITTTILAKE